MKNIETSSLKIFPSQADSKSVLCDFDNIFPEKKIHIPPIQGFSNTSNPPPPLPPQNFHMLAFRVLNIGSGHPIPKPGSHLKNTPWVTGLGKFKDS